MAETSSAGSGVANLTESQEFALQGVRRTHGLLVEAHEHLQRALQKAQPGREQAWAGEVARELSAAAEAVAAHRTEVESDQGLYAELRLDAPWLLPRLNQMVEQLARVARQIADLQLDALRVAQGDYQGLAAIRHDAERMLENLRSLMAKEADLTFERFNQPVALD